MPVGGWNTSCAPSDSEEGSGSLVMQSLRYTVYVFRPFPPLPTPPFYGYVDENLILTSVIDSFNN